MSISFEWDTDGADLAVVAVADYEENGIYSEVDSEPGTYALVIGGESGGGMIIEGSGGLADLQKFAARVQAIVAKAILKAAEARVPQAGPVTGQMSADESEVAVRTLGELARGGHLVGAAADGLSERQVDVVELVASLMEGEGDERTA